MNLADEVIEAHGGLSRWQATGSVNLRVWAGGLAFRTKGHTQTLQDVTASVGIGQPLVALAGRHPSPWHYPFGDRPERLTNACRGRWSLAQVAAFTAGALWTYVNAPLLPFLDGVTLEAPKPRHHRTRVLRLTLPAGLGAHGPHHTLLIDERGIIRRHHYVATAFGRWAVASQSVDDHQPFDGLLIGTRRRVTPRLLPTHGAPGPTLVSIRLQPTPPPS